MNKLKPCPFCGEELEIIANGQYYSHKREENLEKQCFGAIWTFPIDDEEMIRRWNTRKPTEDVVNGICEEIDKCNSKLNKNPNTVNMLALCERRQAFREALWFVDKEVMK